MRTPLACLLAASLACAPPPQLTYIGEVDVRTSPPCPPPKLAACPEPTQPDPEPPSSRRPAPRRTTPRPLCPNTASRRQLETLPGVGPAIASRIIASRPYHQPSDLLRVRGIGPATLERIRPYLQFPPPELP